ncbi:MAG: GGDEF domain-containing protein [Magnetococcales bacterium]|nr:GGDEF domain-containing protein [Magnetococcales bacterium]
MPEDILKFDARLRGAVVEMTGQGDEQSLVHVLVRNLAILVPVSNIRFYQGRQEKNAEEGEGNQWKVLLLLNPNEEFIPMSQVEGLAEAMDLGQEVVLKQAGDGPILVVHPIKVDNFQGFLVLDCDKYASGTQKLVHFFLRIFGNQISMIQKKERDPLTGLLNRQSFDDKINKILMAYQRGLKRRRDNEDKGANLAVLDIDHFKRVNDNFGHLIGDEVLILFARLMEQCFRLSDFLFRFGGEEFIVLVNDVTEKEGLAALERFRNMVAAYPFPQVGRVTVSIGTVILSADEVSTTLIDKADKALYYAKENGRNQVQVYQTLVAQGKLEEEDEDDEGDVDLWD